MPEERVARYAAWSTPFLSRSNFARPYICRFTHEGQADVTHLDEEAVQGCLIDDRPGQYGLAVRFVRDGEAVNAQRAPGRPGRVKVSLDTDVVDRRPAPVSVTS